MFLMVNANVRHESNMIRQVRKNPQQLEFYGSESNIGRAPKISKNLITFAIVDLIDVFHEEPLEEVYFLLNSSSSFNYFMFELSLMVIIVRLFS